MMAGRSDNASGSGRRRRGRRARRAVAPAAAAFLVAASLLSQDFYEASLRAGERAYRERRFPDAIAELKIAAFGLLDRPALETEALAVLALAQDRGGRAADARETLARFVEVEKRAATYPPPGFDPALRAEFDALARRGLPAETARSVLSPRTRAAGPPTAVPPTRAAAVLPTPAPAPAGVAPAATPTAASVARFDAPTPTRPAPTAPATSSPHAAPATHTSLPLPATPPPTRAARLDRTERARPGPPAAVTPRGPSSAGGLLVEPEQVDRLPQLKRTIKPSYPDEALRAGAGGVVLLRVLVSERGDALEVQVVREIRPDLARAAVAAVRNWTFEPARQGRRAVRTWTFVAVPFDPARG